MRDKDKLEEYGVADAVEDLNIDFGYSCWPQSKATLQNSDIPPPRTPSPLPLPDLTDSGYEGIF